MKTILTSVLLFTAALSYSQDTISYQEYIIEQTYTDVERERNEQVALISVMIANLRAKDLELDFRSTALIFCFAYDMTLEMYLDYVNEILVLNRFPTIDLVYLEQVFRNERKLYNEEEDVLMLNMYISLKYK